MITSFWSTWFWSMVLGAIAVVLAAMLSGCPAETDGDPDAGDMPHYPMPRDTYDGGPRGGV